MSTSKFADIGGTWFVRTRVLIYDLINSARNGNWRSRKVHHLFFCQMDLIV